MSFDFEKLRRSILAEHNRLREEPKSYIKILEKNLTYFREGEDDILRRPGQNPIKLHEGKPAFLKAIELLKKQKPVHPLTYDERLSKACQEHVDDHGPKGTISHESSLGKSVSERIETYCEWEINCGENLDLGSLTGEDVIVSMLIDDGNKNKGHRANLFNEQFNYFGIASGKHKEFNAMTCIKYAGGLRDLGSPYFDYANFKYDYPEEVSSIRKKEVKETKEVKPKNVYQLQDSDAPDGTVGVKIDKRTRLVMDPVKQIQKKLAVTKKVFTKDDGTYHVVELEDY
jgi:hypothetical protein